MEKPVQKDGLFLFSGTMFWRNLKCFDFVREYA